MTAGENPAPRPSTAADAAEPRDNLEHWLSDLRTDVTANPSSWIDAESDGEDPAGRAPGPDPVPQGRAETDVPGRVSVGRHRSPE